MSRLDGRRLKRFEQSVDFGSMSTRESRGRIRVRAAGRGALPRYLTAAALASLVMSGCAASVHVTAGVVNDSAYNAKWSSAWSQIYRDAKPYITTRSSPGVCDIGGTKQGCYDTDQHVVSDLQAMRSSLTGTKVPKQFRSANDILQQAIRTTVAGLEFRDEAIAQNDDQLFQRSQQILPAGHALFARAYAAYPGYARPQPAPIL